MTKRIILEGPDGSGKTTLIQTLIGAYPDQLYFMDGFKHSDEPEYSDWLAGVMYPKEEPGGVPVHNRLYYSELVYGPILRGFIDLEPHFSSVVKHKLREEAFLIYCNLEYGQLIQSAVTNEQMEGVLPNLRKIYHAYDDLMGEEMAFYWPQGRCVSYNFRRDQVKQVIKLVGEYLEH